MYEFAFASYVDHTITFYTDNRVNKFSEDAFRRAVASLGKKGWQIVAVNNGLYLQRAGLPNKASTRRGGTVAKSSKSKQPPRR
jgi:hypothetical protein